MAGENNPIMIETRSQPYWSNRLYNNLDRLFQNTAANQERVADIQARKDVNADIQQVRQQLASTTDPEQKQQLQDKLDKLISQRQELENKRYAAQANFYNALGNIASSAWDKGRAHDQSSAYLNEQAAQHQTEAAEYQRAQQANMQIANRDTRQEAERTAASEGAFKAQQAAAHLSADAGSGAAALAAAKAATDVTPDYARYEQRSDERRDTALDNAQSRYTSQQFGIQERKAAASEDYQTQQQDRYNNQVQALSAGNSPYVVTADTITNKEETSNSNPSTEVTDNQGEQTQNNNQSTVVTNDQTANKEEPSTQQQPQQPDNTTSNNNTIFKSDNVAGTNINTVGNAIVDDTSAKAVGSNMKPVSSTEADMLRQRITLPKEATTIVKDSNNKYYYEVLTSKGKEYRPIDTSGITMQNDYDLQLQ